MGSGRLQRIFSHATEYARLKLDLLEADFEQERSRLASVLLRSTSIALCLLVAVQLLLAIVIVLSWHTPWRILVMATLALLMVALSAMQYHALRRYQARAPRLQLRSENTLVRSEDTVTTLAASDDRSP